MTGHLASTALVLQLLFGASPRAEDPRPAPVEEPKDWTTRKVLPLLRAERLTPVKDREHFRDWAGYYAYRRLELGEERTERFDNEKDAVKPAKAFLEEHFGPLPDPVFPVRFTRDWDAFSTPGGRDLVVVFEARHHGIPLLGCGAVVYFRGRIVVMASVSLTSVTPLPDSEREIISRQQAIRAWNEQAPANWKKAIKPKNLRMIYVWSVPDNIGSNARKQGAAILRPNWEMSDPLLIDAFEGTLWRNG